MINARKRFGLVVAGLALRVAAADQTRAGLMINVTANSSTPDDNGAIYAQDR